MQHERAAIMALTFCIGFTTAFIAYGLPETSVPGPIVQATNSQRAAVIDTQPTGATAPVTSKSNVAPGVSLDADGLWLLANGEEYLVSPSASFAPEMEEAHVDIHQAVVRNDGAYLFFCAETPAAAGMCEPRVFDVENYRVHRVESQGQTGNLEPATMDVTWLADGSLNINGYTSVSLATPWVVE